MKRLLSKVTEVLNPPRAAVLKLQGNIHPFLTYEFMNQLSLVKLNKIKALAIYVDSYGGLPAQADIIVNRINYLKAKHKFKVYGFVSDKAMSAGYAVLCAADEIYAYQNAVVGSIGAVINKIDLSKVLQRIQVECHTIQSQKTLTTIQNPLSELTAQDKRILKKLCENTHRKFIDLVKTSRGDRIPKSQQIQKQIFDGKLFYGQKAFEYGLIDGYGHYFEVLNRKFPGVRIQQNFIKEPERKFFF